MANVVRTKVIRMTGARSEPQRRSDCGDSDGWQCGQRAVPMRAAESEYGGESGGKRLKKSRESGKMNGIMSITELPKNYDAASAEPRIYQRWLDSGFFNPDTCIEKGVTPADAKPFTIMMPPPNVTGVLHMGHAMMLTLEDIMVRFARMRGRRTLWLPGTDHAAIATQSVVEKSIHKKEGVSRHDLGREELLRRVEAFAKESHATITSQIKVMGASCDWSREAFTLDEQRSLAVRTMFKKMYDDGLIYRGNRIINWDPKGQTTISDDEIAYEERAATLYTFRYAKDFPIPIATTRPETKVGDTGVAVHPNDERYAKYIGKEYDVNFCGVSLHIKIVADKEVNPAFGTGAVGVTPAHSMIDWEMAQRHDLPVKQVINEYARMTVETEQLKDKKVLEARDTVVAWLKEENLLEKEEDTVQNVATADRTGGIIEPMPKLQWFISVNAKFKIQNSNRETTLKDIMREPVADGRISIIPDYFGKTYFHWIDTLRDWCISRQIWYGHRIPVWYRKKVKSQKSKVKSLGTESDSTEVYCDVNPPEGDEWEQDSDTLDTWFSSGLWTFSTLGWPSSAKASEGKPSDLEIYHPTDILETGYEILFFWVARMVLMTGYALNDIPFRTVYLHGTVRDAQGRKMSKSLGNGIDPLDVAQKFGADAGRMALVVGNTPGTDSRISEDKIRAYKYFANKLWNITRFVLMSVDSEDVVRFATAKPEVRTDADRDILTKLDAAIADITGNLDRHIIHEAANQAYQFAWRELADVYLEASKGQLADESLKSNTGHILVWCLMNTLKLVHPFAPFVTEELWGKLFGESDTSLLMVQCWPT
ncbi:MAG: valine--tRNA ligase [Patescibacteria group bacterium]